MLPSVGQLTAKHNHGPGLAQTRRALAKTLVLSPGWEAVRPFSSANAAFLSPVSDAGSPGHR